MLASIRISVRSTVPRQSRFYSLPVEDVRTRLMGEVKAAMKNRDSSTSTTVRSVLSEVYAADKTANEIIPSSSVMGIIRKAVTRRSESAIKFMEASRPDLADKEKKEAEILSKFLPPLLPEDEIERSLSEIIETFELGADPRKSLGRVFQSFYSKVDKSTVNSDVVKRKAEELLANRAK